MTVGDLIERLLRLPDFASDMLVTIRDEEREVDHPIYSQSAVYLDFNFTNPDDEVRWREGRLPRNGTVLDRLLRTDDLDEHDRDDDGA